jgi:uncharacterized protein YndB with AHSA1/START domain
MLDRTIEIRKTIEGSPDRVFRALTDADELSRWWTTRAESDPRTGGSFSYTWEFQEDTERNHTREGEYLEITPGKNVRYDWPMPLGNTVVDFRVDPRGDRAELTLLHSGWGAESDWDESLEMHRQGWSFFLDNLKAYLERGEDARETAMGLKTAAAVN